MSTVLSLLGVAVFIVCVISVAAAITWGVVKLVPPKTKPAAEKTSSR
jgi:hypothetical protein